MANDEIVRKKPRTSFSGGTPSGSKSSDFRPFQYEGKNFSDFARGIIYRINNLNAISYAVLVVLCQL